MPTPGQNILYPVGDIYVTDWRNEDADASALYTSVDEGVFSPNDSDWIETSGVVGVGITQKVVFQMDSSNIKPVHPGGNFNKTGAVFYGRVGGKDLEAATLLLNDIWWYDSNIKTIGSGLLTTINPINVGPSAFINVSGQISLASEPAGGWNMQATYLHTQWGWTSVLDSGIRISAMEIYNSGEMVEFGEGLTLFIKGASSLDCYDEFLTDLISYWKMDELTGDGYTIRRDSVRNNHLYVGGRSVTHTTGASSITNNAINMSEENTGAVLYNATTGSQPDLSRLTNNISIFGWTKFAYIPPLENISRYGIVSKGADPFNDELWEYDIHYDKATSQFRAVIGDGLNSVILPFNNNTIQSHRWYHIGLTWDMSINELKTYINGIQSNQIFASSILPYSNNPTYLSFGTQGLQSVTDRYLNGDLDEWGFWKRVLNSGEVNLIYNEGNGLSYPFCPYLPLYIEGALPTGIIPLYIAGTNTYGCNDELRYRLVSYWKMDELGGGIRYDSVSTNHLTEDGILGHQNGATHLTNKSVEIDYLNNASLFHNDNNDLSRYNDDISLFCWIRINEIYGSPGQIQTIVDKSSSNFTRDTEYSLILDTSPNRFRGIMGDSTNGVTFDISTTTVAVNTWYYTGFTYVRSLNLAVSGSTVQTYLNGQLQSTIAINVSGQNNPGDFTVGSHNTNSNRYLDGAVDELGLWKKALNSGEVYELYNGGNGFVYPFCPYLPLYIEGLTPSSGITLYISGMDDFNCIDTYQSGLLAYWKLEEQTGTRYDSHSTYHLSDVSGVLAQNPGIVNTAANFDRAQGQHLVLPNQTGLTRGDNDFTIAGWCYLGDTSTNQIFISNSIDPSFSGTTDYALWYNSSTSKTAFSLSNGSLVSTIESDWLGFTQAGYWYYVAGTYEKNANTAQLYVNGQLQSTLGLDRSGFTHTSGNFALGAIGTSTAYSGVTHGYLDEFAIWNRVLTSGEINRLYFGNEQYGLTYPFCPIQLPLYIQGMSPSSGDVTLYTMGVAPESGNITLYMAGHLPASGGFEPFTLFIEGAAESEFFPLFIKGKSPDTADKNLSLFIYATPSGIGGQEANFPLFIHGLGSAGYLPLFIGGPAFGAADSSCFPLFIKTSGNLDGSITEFNQCTLFVQNSWQVANNNITLFVSGDGLTEGAGVSNAHLPLYINRGADNIGGQGSISLFIPGTPVSESGLSLHLLGGNLTANSGISLVIPQVVGPINSGLMLFSHGY